MAWEWVAPVTTSALGIVGVVATYRTGKGGRQHSEAVARAASDHAARMARETRQQERLADAYVRLLEMVGDFTRYASEVRPRLDTIPPRKIEPPPSWEEQNRVWARVNAYGSRVVREKCAEFRDAVRQVIFADEDLGWAEQDRAAGVRDLEENPFLIRKRLRVTLKPAVERLQRELEGLVAEELGHRVRGGEGSGGDTT